MTPQFKTFLTILFVLTIAGAGTGCAAQRGALKEHAQKAAQAQFETSRYAFCAGNTTGELLRQGESEREKFIEFCKDYAR